MRSDETLHQPTSSTSQRSSSTLSASDSQLFRLQQRRDGHGHGHGHGHSHSGDAATSSSQARELEGSLNESKKSASAKELHTYHHGDSVFAEGTVSSWSHSYTVDFHHKNGDSAMNHVNIMDGNRDHADENHHPPASAPTQANIAPLNYTSSTSPVSVSPTSSVNEKTHSRRDDHDHQSTNAIKIILPLDIQIEPDTGRVTGVRYPTVSYLEKKRVRSALDVSKSDHGDNDDGAEEAEGKEKNKDATLKAQKLLAGGQMKQGLKSGLHTAKSESRLFTLSSNLKKSDVTGSRKILKSSLAKTSAFGDQKNSNVGGDKNGTAKPAEVKHVAIDIPDETQSREQTFTTGNEESNVAKNANNELDAPISTVVDAEIDLDRATSKSANINKVSNIKSKVYNRISRPSTNHGQSNIPPPRSTLKSRSSEKSRPSTSDPDVSILDMGIMTGSTSQNTSFFTRSMVWTHDFVNHLLDLDSDPLHKPKSPNSPLSRRPSRQKSSFKQRPESRGNPLFPLPVTQSDDTLVYHTTDPFQPHQYHEQTLSSSLPPLAPSTPSQTLSDHAIPNTKHTEKTPLHAPKNKHEKIEKQISQHRPVKTPLKIRVSSAFHRIPEMQTTRSMLGVVNPAQANVHLLMRRAEAGGRLMAKSVEKTTGSRSDKYRKSGVRKGSEAIEESGDEGKRGNSSKNKNMAVVQIDQSVDVNNMTFVIKDEDMRTILEKFDGVGGDGGVGTGDGDGVDDTKKHTQSPIVEIGKRFTKSTKGAKRLQLKDKSDDCVSAARRIKTGSRHLPHFNSTFEIMDLDNLVDWDDSSSSISSSDHVENEKDHRVEFENVQYEEGELEHLIKNLEDDNIADEKIEKEYITVETCSKKKRKSIHPSEILVHKKLEFIPLENIEYNTPDEKPTLKSDKQSKIDIQYVETDDDSAVPVQTENTTEAVDQPDKVEPKSPQRSRTGKLKIMDMKSFENEKDIRLRTTELNLRDLPISKMIQALKLPADTSKSPKFADDTFKSKNVKVMNLQLPQLQAEKSDSMKNIIKVRSKDLKSKIHHENTHRDMFSPSKFKPRTPQLSMTQQIISIVQPKIDSKFLMSLRPVSAKHNASLNQSLTEKNTGRKEKEDFKDIDDVSDYSTFQHIGVGNPIKQDDEDEESTMDEARKSNDEFDDSISQNLPAAYISQSPYNNNEDTIEIAPHAENHEMHHHLSDNVSLPSIEYHEANDTISVGHSIAHARPITPDVPKCDESSTVISVNSSEMVNQSSVIPSLPGLSTLPSIISQNSHSFGLMSSPTPWQINFEDDTGTKNISDQSEKWKHTPDQSSLMRAISATSLTPNRNSLTVKMPNRGTLKSGKSENNLIADHTTISMSNLVTPAGASTTNLNSKNSLLSRSNVRLSSKTKPAAQKRKKKAPAKLGNIFAALAFAGTDFAGGLIIDLPLRQGCKCPFWLQNILKHSLLIYESVRRIQRVWRRCLIKKRARFKTNAIKTIQRWYRIIRVRRHYLKTIELKRKNNISTTLDLYMKQLKNLSKQLILTNFDVETDEDADNSNSDLNSPIKTSFRRYIECKRNGADYLSYNCDNDVAEAWNLFAIFWKRSVSKYFRKAQMALVMHIIGSYGKGFTRIFVPQIVGLIAEREPNLLREVKKKKDVKEIGGLMPEGQIDDEDDIIKASSEKADGQPPEENVSELK